MDTITATTTFIQLVILCIFARLQKFGKRVRQLINRRMTRSAMESHASHSRPTWAAVSALPSMPSVLNRLISIAICMVMIAAICARPAQAQAVTWTQTDLNSATPTGTFSYNSGTHTYTITGGGAGISGATDSGTFAYARVSGPTEIIAHVNSVSNTNANALAGVMIRGSLDPRASQASVGFSPSAAVLVSRSSDGGNDSRGTNSSFTSPAWVRLVVIGTTATAYVSNDGISWTQLFGSQTVSLPSVYYAGFVVSSNVSGTSCTGTFDRFSLMTNRPDPNDASLSLQLWLRADVGVTYSGTAVSAWNDQSNNHYNASQSTSTKQPTLNTNAVNGFPSIGFDGIAKYMTLAGVNGFNLSTGTTMFAVIDPTSPASNQRILDLYKDSSNEVALMETSGSGDVGLYVNKTTSQQLGTSTTSNTYQTVEVIQNSSGGTTLLVNGTQTNTGTVQNTSATTTSPNTLGADNVGGNLFAGNICELIVCKGALTATQRQKIESYLYGKYQFGAPTASAPTISPSINQVAASPQTISLTNNTPAAFLYVTTDGSSPAQTSPMYSSPIQVSGASTEIQAMAGGPNFVSSSTAGPVFVQVDPSSALVPRSGLRLWLKADNGVLLSSGANVGTWYDSSGNQFSLPESGNASLIQSAINGQPAVQFGSSSLHALSPANSINPANGSSVFAVCQPTSSAGANTRFLVELGTNSSSYTDSLSVRQLVSGGSDQLQLYSNNGGSAQTLTTSNGLIIGQNHLVESVHTVSNTGTVYVDMASTSGTVQTPTFTDTNNFVAGSADGLSSSAFIGDIAELIVFERPVSDSERSLIERYLIQKYTLPVPPTFLVTGGSLSAPCQIPLRADGTIHYTIDGSTPSDLSPIYQQPIWVNYSQTIKAISVKNGISSPVSSASYTLNSTTYPAPNPADSTPPTVTITLPTATQ